MDSTEALIKHLEMIERVVTQFSNKSFLLKGWTITAVAALLALSGSTKTPVPLYVAFLPTLGLWVLDGYFLSKERCFRKLFYKVQSELKTSSNTTKLTISSDDRDPCMPFTMDASMFEKGKTTWLRTLFSNTLVIFYGSILAILTASTLVSLLTR
jgi:hypothetical protein